MGEMQAGRRQDRAIIATKILRWTRLPPPGSAAGPLVESMLWCGGWCGRAGAKHLDGHQGCAL